MPKARKKVRGYYFVTSLLFTFVSYCKAEGGRAGNSRARSLISPLFITTFGRQESFLFWIIRKWYGQKQKGVLWNSLLFLTVPFFVLLSVHQFGTTIVCHCYQPEEQIIDPHSYFPPLQLRYALALYQYFNCKLIWEFFFGHFVFGQFVSGIQFWAFCRSYIFFWYFVFGPFLRVFFREFYGLFFFFEHATREPSSKV